MSVAVIIVIIAVVYWAYHVRRYPIRRCPACKGTKKNTGNASSLRWGVCGKCGGKGEVRRFGAPRQ